MAPNAKDGYGACTIYAITDLTHNDEKVYIGSCAKPLYARWGQHLHDTYYKHSSDIQKLIRTRPWEFKPAPVGPVRVRKSARTEHARAGVHQAAQPQVQHALRDPGHRAGLKGIAQIPRAPVCRTPPASAQRTIPPDHGGGGVG